MIEGNPTLSEHFMLQSDREEFRASIKHISRWARSFKERWLISAMLCAFIGSLFLFVGWIERRDLAYLWYVGLVIELIAFVLWYAPYLIWRRLYEGPIYRDWPKVLKSDDATAMLAFIRRCADGVIKVETHLGERIDPSHFRTIVAVLLLSDDVIDRTLVRSKVGFRTYRAQLHVINEQVGRVVPLPSDEPALLKSNQLGVDLVATDIVSSHKSEDIQLIVDAAAADNAIQDRSEGEQQQAKTAFATPIDISNRAAASSDEATQIDNANLQRGGSGPRSRNDRIMQVAAMLDKENISKRDVKSHHIAERWDESSGVQPDVGSVRALMKGQQAGAPSKTKVSRPTNAN